MIVFCFISQKFKIGLIHILQVFGACLKAHIGTKDPVTKKPLKGFSRILPGMFDLSWDDASLLQRAVANHALMVFALLKDVSNCRDHVRAEVSSKKFFSQILRI